LGIFGRRKDTDLSEESLDPQEPVAPNPPPGEPGVDRDWDRALDGPYDITELADSAGKVDLGALRVPAVKGMELRLDVEQGSGRVVGVTMGIGTSRLQLQVFATPRSTGIWREVREEIAEGVRKTGGTADVTDGVLGTELRCRMPGKATDGRVAFQPARFVGVDGPRWFLRGVVNGPAAADDEALRPLLGLLRQVVVSRGEEPRPPREVLVLQPPKEVVEVLEQRAAAARPTGKGRTPGGTAAGGTAAGGSGTAAAGRGKAGEGRG